MDNFLSRDLFSGEYKLTVEVGKPVEKDGQWISEVRFRHYVDRCELIFGTDSADCILNVFAFLHSELNSMELKFARFPSEGDTWHWFPIIPPPSIETLMRG